MKKFLLLIALFGLVSTVASANSEAGSLKIMKPTAQYDVKSDVTPMDDTQNAIIFGYCEDKIAGLGTGAVNATLKASIGISATKAKEWKGNQITKVRIGFGNCSNRNVLVYISKTLSGAPIYSQTALLTNLNGWNEVVLNTPYEIDGSSFYIGYQVVTRSTEDYPLGVDGVPTSNRLANSIYDGASWGSYGSSYGSVCIKIAVAGDNLPEYEIALNEYDVPSVVVANSAFDASVYFTNNGSATISDATVSCRIGEDVVAPSSVKLIPETVVPGDKGQILLEGLVCKNEGSDIPMTMAITKLNGQIPGNITDNVVNTVISSAKEVYKKNVVVEEWTGNWCGFCPRGIVGMEYMVENYLNDGFIPIAVHSSQTPGSGNEPMECKSYLPIVNRLADGFPGCTMNRATGTFDPNAEYLELYYDYISRQPSIVKVDLDANYNAQTSQIDVDARVDFSLSSESSPFKLAFVITEDSVGPYSQSNYFANNAYGEMDGWERKGSRVNMLFNHVARDIFGAYGLDNSLPVSVNNKQQYTYSMALSTDNVGDVNNCQVIALVINSKTGQIENAARTSLRGQAGVGNIVADGPVDIFVSDSGLTISGQYLSGAVYALDGTYVRTLRGEDNVELAPGIYIVKVSTDSGVVAGKVFVK